jgi:uncharacterized protein
MTTGPDSPQQPNDPTPPPPGYGPPPPPGYGPPAPGYGQAPPPVGGYSAALRPDEEKMWAIGAHLGGIILGFIAPLVIWLVYKDRSRFLDRQGKEALNFQITLLIGYVVSLVLTLVLIGLVLFFVVWLGGIVLMVLASIKAANFEDYRYPVNIRLIK